ncbi:helix-turn-helix domain-containing protein [Nocardia sp. CA-128927]|uniref:helix-turn-helix domain-containing protein n=1 Tax=Nocardia sp. CA-128927 TaxID=3239975 RepID=UPI003D96317C
MARGPVAPEPFASWMVEQGYTDPYGKPSMTALATAAGLGPTTVHRLFRTVRGNGDTQPDPPTISKLAKALNRAVDEISAVFKIPAKASEVWKPPVEIEFLDRGDLVVIDELVKRLAFHRRKTIAAEAALATARS